MNDQMKPDDPLTALVRRRIKEGAEPQFEALMQEFIALAIGAALATHAEDRDPQSLLRD